MVANDKSSNVDAIPHERKEPRPDFSQLPEPKKLPKSIQDTLDSDEKLWDALYDGTAPESTDSNVRYAAYAARVKTILLSAHRYVAYTSDVGESFRPIAHPYLVRGAYAVSWAYLAGDVAHEGYKAYLRNQRVLNRGDLGVVGKAEAELRKKTGDLTSDKETGIVGSAKKLGEDIGGMASASVKASPDKIPAIEDYRAVMAQRAVFQSVASMGLPAFTIHSIVRYSGRALKDAKNVKIRTWGPIGLGLAAVPFLPFVFDEPVERAVEWVFHQGFRAIGGPGAVGERPMVGRQTLLDMESKASAKKEKEL